MSLQDLNREIEQEPLFEGPISQNMYENIINSTQLNYVLKFILIRSRKFKSFFEILARAGAYAERKSILEKIARMQNG